MQKVLIITYYWPPSGGSGVQRWLKFAKYLPQNGWLPFIFTPENPAFEVKDESLVQDISDETEVIKLPIWEPYSLVEKFKKSDRSQQSDLVKKQNKNLLNKLLLWIRGNFFIPDPRIFWIRPAVKILGELLSSNGINTIITTGPPHSMHLIGLKLKQKYSVKWLADFRDPWTRWDLYDNFYLSSLARRKHENLERKVLQKADQVISVSDHYASELANIGGRDVKVVTNGFDAEDFEYVVKDANPESFIIRHMGVVDELRDPRPFLKALRSLAEEGHSFKAEFVGNINRSLKAGILDDSILVDLVTFRPYIPHAEVLTEYKRSTVLLLILASTQNASGNIPGKLFEYMASKRPILAIGSKDGDSAAIIEKSSAGVVCESTDVNSIKQAILKLHSQFQKGEELKQNNIMSYSRKSLTSKLAGILNEL